MPVDDECPLPRVQRLLGHEVQTIAVALDLAARNVDRVLAHAQKAVILAVKAEVGTLQGRGLPSF